jgi:hypothetical protein
MKKVCNFILVFLFANAVSFAQNLTGTWEGSSGGNYCRLVILQINDSCFGYTYDTGMGYCKANFLGQYKEASKKLSGKNPNFIERTPLHALSTYHLFYSAKNNQEYLKGRAAAKSTAAKILSFGLPIPVSYKKISNEIDTTRLIAAKIAVYLKAADKNKAAEPVVVATIATAPDSSATKIMPPVEDLKITKESRVSKLIKTIDTNADSVKLILYDNGEIDGDTVTVFYNGEILINKLPLGLKPYETIVALHKTGTTNSIELMANNLGSIPPNTALMIILCGNKRYELRVSADFNENAKINIQFNQ